MPAASEEWPFHRVLVANRGEIAVRVIRACRDLGLTAIAVYTDQDAHADFVTLADDAWRIDGSTAAQTYLNIDAMLDIARRSKAQAVHPGYGYLAESPEFAAAVVQAGLTWVGPPAHAIEQLGDKAGARSVAQAVDAPITPGSGRAVTDVNDALSLAQEIGYPIAVKAVHGGGGRGFRTAASAAELPEALRSAQNEATAAFGRGECLLERQIVEPRHIETQCLADAHGTVHVVSTRDCSVQRRNQKIIEEAPAVRLSAEQSDAVIQSSRAILAHVGYVGAATCEFLVGRDGTLSFMEANARIQVEHTVTEEVAGTDLVAWQLRIAAGQRLPESGWETRGHSIEFRINAEDPAQGFMPATGTISRLREPAGPGVRMDSGVSAGTVVGTAFDPMVAKLIVTGEDREQALARARRALREYELDGVATLLPVHRAILEAEDFAAGSGIHTRWLEETFMPSYSASAQKTSEPSADAAESTTDVVVEVDGHRITVRVPAHLAAQSAVQDPAAGPSRPKRKKKAASAETGAALTAPMQGTVVRVDVEPGQTVAKGETLTVIEAMKMEQPLKAAADAVIDEVRVSSGTTVKPGEVLVTFRQ